MANDEEQSPTSTAQTGVAGRTNYAQWDKFATDLVEQVETEDQQEAESENAKLGLDGKYARSQAEAEERSKQKEAEQTKAQLDSFRERENQLVYSVSHEGTTETMSSTTIRVTRADLGPQQRVLRIAQCSHATVILSSDLSLLESAAPAPLPTAKTNADDAENAVDEAAAANNRKPILGVIKVFCEDVQHVDLRIECKIITGCIELHKCDHVNMTVHTTVPTIQADECTDLRIVHPTPHHAPTDRILHAGCDNLHISVPTSDRNVTHSTVCNYLQDGAVAIGNATPEEFQFVTTLHNDLITTKPVKTADDHDPSAAAESLKQKGNEAFGAGEYAQAVLHYSMAIDQDEQNDVLYSNRAAALLKLGEHHKAQRDAQQALTINPNNVKAMFRCGLAYHAAGDYATALSQYLGPASQLQPNNKAIQQALQFSQVRFEQEQRKRMGK